MFLSLDELMYMQMMYLTTALWRKSRKSILRNLEGAHFLGSLPYTSSREKYAFKYKKDIIRGILSQK